jgi:hypothetical protein
MFIASSTERQNLAFAAQESLERDVEATVWTQSVFAPSKPTLTSLVDVLRTSDFALFILAPDDLVAMRDRTQQAVRDNVILELGLFIGRLGVERCFLVVPRGTEDLHLPTDLLGITPLMFDPDRGDGNWVAALGPACNRIRQVVAEAGRAAPDTVSALTTLEGRITELDRRVTEGLGQIRGSVSDVQSSIGTERVPEQQLSFRDELRGFWSAIRDRLEEIAADPTTDGRTRAKYGRIDRRNYGDLVKTLAKDAKLGRNESKYWEAIEIWQKYKSGLKAPSDEDVMKMKRVAELVASS